MISLLKYLDSEWPIARGYLRKDLDTIESTLNQRWNAVFSSNNLLSASTIAGDSTLATRYIANTGPLNTLQWDQINLSNGVSSILGVTHGGTGTPTAFTQGSVVFAGVSGVYSQDNANLFWDDANNRLGIRTASPTSTLTLIGDVTTGAEIEIHNLYANGISIYTHSATSFRAPTLTLFRSKGTQASPAAPANGDWLSYYQSGGYNSGDGAYVTGFQIATKAAGDWTIAGTVSTTTTFVSGGTAFLNLGSSGATGTVGILTPASSLYGLNIGGSARSTANILATPTDLTTDVTGVFSTPIVLGATHLSGIPVVMGIQEGAFAQSAQFIGLKTRSTDNDANTIVQNNDGIFRLEGYGADGAAYRSAGHIELQVDGTPGLSDMPGRWIFTTTPDGSATPTERMRIDSAGLTTITGSLYSTTIIDTLTGYRIGGTATANRVLRGNGTNFVAAQVDLSTDVTGDLPFSSLVQASGASVLVGRGSAAGAGDFQEITLGAGLAFAGTVLSTTAGVVSQAQVMTRVMLRT